MSADEDFISGVPAFPKVEASAYVLDGVIYIRLQPHRDVQPFPCRFSLSHPEARRFLRSLEEAIHHTSPPRERQWLTR